MYTVFRVKEKVCQGKPFVEILGCHLKHQICKSCGLAGVCLPGLCPPKSKGQSRLLIWNPQLAHRKIFSTPFRPNLHLHVTGDFTISPSIGASCKTSVCDAIVREKEDRKLINNRRICRAWQQFMEAQGPISNPRLENVLGSQITDLIRHSTG